MFSTWHGVWGFRRTASDKILRHKTLNIAKYAKYDGYLRGLASMVCKFYDKKYSGNGIKNEIISNKELAKELHKPIIRKFNKRKVHSTFIDNVCDTDLADMQLISKFNKIFKFLLCAVDIYSKYAWVIPLKDMLFQKVWDESKRKPNKIWIDKGSEFYNRLMKSWLERNNIEMYSTNNEGKSVIGERLIRTLKDRFINTWLQYQKMCILIN